MGILGGFLLRGLELGAPANRGIVAALSAQALTRLLGVVEAKAVPTDTEAVHLAGVVLAVLTAEVEWHD